MERKGIAIFNAAWGRRTEPTRIVPKRALMISFEGIPLMTLYLNSVDEIMNSEETMQ